MPFNAQKYINITNLNKSRYVLEYESEDDTPLAIVQQRLQKPLVRSIIRKNTLKTANSRESISNDIKHINRKETILDGKILVKKKKVVINEEMNTIRYFEKENKNKNPLITIFPNRNGYYL